MSEKKEKLKKEAEELSKLLYRRHEDERLRELFREYESLLNRYSNEIPSYIELHDELDYIESDMDEAIKRKSGYSSAYKEIEIGLNIIIGKE